jgi:hypothetical protein
MTGASLKSSFLFSWIPPHYSREELFLLALYQTLPHFDAPNFSNGIHFKGKKIAKKEGRETPKKEKKRKENPGLGAGVGEDWLIQCFYHMLLRYSRLVQPGFWNDETTEQEDGAQMRT